MFKKRLFSYIIDIFILSLVLGVIGMFIPSGSNIESLNNELMNINNNFVNGELGIRTFINQYAGIFYNIDKEMFYSSLTSVIVSILYFVVYPLYNNGQSFGKKMNNIKIVSNDDSDVSANSLIFRYLLMASHYKSAEKVRQCLRELKIECEEDNPVMADKNKNSIIGRREAYIFFSQIVKDV